MPNQDKRHEHNAHCPVGNSDRPVGNSDRPLIEIIEPCEDVTSIDPDTGLNKAQENFTLLKPQWKTNEVLHQQQPTVMKQRN